MSDKIYFASSGTRIKIGVTQNVERRLKEVEVHLAEPLALLGVIDGSLQSEKALHAQFAAYHLNGEWFRNCAEIRALISDLLSAPVRDWLFVSGRLRAKSAPPTDADGDARDLMERARIKWPRRTAQHLADCTGLSVRACKYWLSGRSIPSGGALLLLQKEFARSSATGVI